jgi:succinate-semialdehyde dehydrogenase/glutarate-semialdehyde dehydrogenase
MTTLTDVRTSALDAVPTELFIAGAWRSSSSGRTFAVDDPATGETVALVADATAADALAALDAAVDAARGWAATPPRTRSEILSRTFALLQERRDWIATIMTTEMGKPLAEAHAEIAYGGESLRWFAEEAVRVSGRHGLNPEGTGDIVVTRQPVGPCYLVTPWNFPLAMATRKIAPALAAGCTVVLKPASSAPLTTLALVTLLAEAGLPPGVVNVVTTSSSRAISGPLLRDPRLRKLSFTGSTEVGRELLEAAAHGILRTSMELGGNAPFLVFDDADLDAAVDGAMKAKFRNIGQACTAANRFLVHESVADEFVRRLDVAIGALEVGPGLQPGTTIGPLINAAAVDRILGLVREAVADGATLVRGGSAVPGAGSYLEPTLLDRVPQTSRITAEEIFGPVVAVTRFGADDEAIRLANATEYGLAAYAFTRDLGRANRLMAELETGMLGINTGLISNAAAPFGGVKQSGLGREGGSEGISEYLSTRYTLIPR